jgi:hypothetical protein
MSEFTQKYGKYAKAEINNIHMPLKPHGINLGRAIIFFIISKSRHKFYKLINSKMSLG